MTTPIKSPWALAELESAIIALRMPSYYTKAGRAAYSTDAYNTIEAGLVAANKCIGELTAEITRLTAALVECQEAFESGRAVGAVVGELAY